MRQCTNCGAACEEWELTCPACGEALADAPLETTPMTDEGDIRYTNEPLAIIAEYTNVMDARLGQQILADAGIQAFVPDEESGTFSWTGMSRMARPVVIVRETESEQAIRVLKQAEAGNPEVRFLEPYDEFEADDDAGEIRL